MLETLAQLNYLTMTPVQAAAVPLALEGHDLIVQARTGSGKTAAFGIAALQRLETAKIHPQCVVLCPTRELAEQVANELRRLARFKANIKILTLCGGVPLAPERDSLRHGAHIIVGTPGRVQDHLGKGSLTLDTVHTLVLDEADRMLDMGFNEAIMKIISNIPKVRQTLLFSATFPQNIHTLSQQIQNDPRSIIIDSRHSHEAIEQQIFKTSEKARFALLEEVILHLVPDTAIIFCNTKLDADSVARELQLEGFSSLPLHGDLDQRDRNETLVLFSNRSCNLLVATDMAARGLDIADVSTVINYELPLDPEVYVHRIGRTGRAGKSGNALSLVTPKQMAALKRIEAYTENPLDFSEPPHESDRKVHQHHTPMQTLMIYGGKKEKLRPGDIVGALIGEWKVENTHIGSIDRFDRVTYVAIDRQTATRLNAGQLTIKKRKFRTKFVGL
jgi:ATP-independent RNA helicase DbpA